MSGFLTKIPFGKCCIRWYLTAWLSTTAINLVKPLYLQRTIPTRRKFLRFLIVSIRTYPALPRSSIIIWPMLKVQSTSFLTRRSCRKSPFLWICWILALMCRKYWIWYSSKKSWVRQSSGRWSAAARAYAPVWLTVKIRTSFIFLISAATLSSSAWIREKQPLIWLRCKARFSTWKPK